MELAGQRVRHADLADARVGEGQLDVEQRVAPYPGDQDLPFGRDFAELLTLSVPQSDTDANLWRLDGTPHTVVAGEIILMPGGISHEVKAVKRFKMLLTLFRSTSANNSEFKAA